VFRFAARALRFEGSYSMNRPIPLIALLVTVSLSTFTPCVADDVSDIKAEVTKRHDEAVKRLQDWIHQVSIAAENRGYPEGADYVIKLLQNAGFQQAIRVET